MSKPISVVKNPNFSIKIFNHNIITFYNYIKMTFSMKERIPMEDNLFTFRKIQFEDISTCAKYGDNSDFLMRKYLTEQSDLTDGYMFYDGGEFVGYIWVMYPGAKNFNFYIDVPYIFYVVVVDEYRGRGYGRHMMEILFSELRKKELESACLVVRKNNLPALSLYKKLNPISCENVRYVRFLKWNIPQYTM